MCEEWAELAERYSKAVNAYKVALMSLPRPNGRGYKAAFLKAEVLKQERDATLKELGEHQREHGC
jgi:hypothetical protein